MSGTKPIVAERTNEFDDLLSCMICFEGFTNPKMLKCGHTFCQQCLNSYHSKYQQQKNAIKGKIPCPTCRELTTISSGGVQALRNDFKVQKIEEMFKTTNLLNTRSSVLCDPCKVRPLVWHIETITFNFNMYLREYI